MYSKDPSQHKSGWARLARDRERRVLRGTTGLDDPRVSGGKNWCNKEGNLVVMGKVSTVWQRGLNETSFGVEACKRR